MIQGRKIGFFANGTFKTFPIEKTCDILSGIGYDAVELDRSWLLRAGSHLTEEMNAITRAGMTLSELIIQLDYVNPDPQVRQAAINDTLRDMETCADAGITTVNLFTGPRPWIPNPITIGKECSLSQGWGMVFTAFDALVPAAERLGINLAVENVWGMVCHDFFTMKYLVDFYRSPVLGVNFDPSHDQVAGLRDMEFLLNGWGKDQIKHIHLKDAVGVPVKGNVLYPPLGDGLVDWAGFWNGLNQIGYEGALSVEYEADQHLEVALNGDWIAAAKDSFARIEKLFGK